MGPSSDPETPDESGGEDQGREQHQARPNSKQPRRRLSFYEQVDGTVDLESDSIGDTRR